MGQTETVLFAVTFIVCEMDMQPTSTPVNAKGQCHLMTLAKGHRLNTFIILFLRNYCANCNNI